MDSLSYGGDIWWAQWLLWEERDNYIIQYLNDLLHYCRIGIYMFYICFCYVNKKKKKILFTDMLFSMVKSLQSHLFTQMNQLGT